jgi:hypothetical protein
LLQPKSQAVLILIIVDDFGLDDPEPEDPHSSSSENLGMQVIPTAIDEK